MPGPWITTSLTAGPITGTTYNFTIPNLTASTIYEYRSYMIVCGVEYFGNTLQIATSATPVHLPTISTSAVTSIGQISAMGCGNVSSDGGASVTARGSVWNTAPNPTIAGCHTVNGSGIGSFSSLLSGLTLNTTYYTRAYATNTQGTAYGNEVSFITLSPSQLYFASVDLVNDNVIMGVDNHVAGNIYSITFYYNVNANSDVGSGNPGDQSQGHAWLEMTTDGITWTQVADIWSYAHGPNGSDSQFISGYTTITNISVVGNVKFRGGWNLEYSSYNTASGGYSVVITGVNGIANIKCNNRATAGGTDATPLLDCTI